MRHENSKEEDRKMNAQTHNAAKHSLPTKALAGFCHSCGICPYADKKQGSTFEQLMRWHRTWCPAWNAHTKVYGEKPLAEHETNLH